MFGYPKSDTRGEEVDNGEGEFSADEYDSDADVDRVAATQGDNQMSRLITLTDITPNRATVVSVIAHESERAALDAATAPNYAVVTEAALVPEAGERVWIENTGRSRGQRVITGRAK